ncbi:MAG: hypothetical protein WD157_00845 [Patescibacteria group bacterium]
MNNTESNWRDMQLRQSQIQRRQAYKSGSVFRIGPTTARYAVLALLAVFSLFYLIQSAQGADSAIELRKLKNQKDTLDQELSTLKINDSRIRSLQNLESSAQK